MEELDILKKEYWEIHMAAEKSPLMQKMTSRQEKVPAIADLAYTRDQLAIHAAIAKRFDELSKSSDPRVEAVVNFQLEGGAFKHLIKENALTEDLESRAKYYQVDLEGIMPTAEACKLAKTLETCEPFDFFCRAYIVLAASLFGGRSIRGAIKKKYEGKISSKALQFPELPVRVRQFSQAFKATLFASFPEQGETEFYRQGTQMFKDFIAVCQAEWARVQ